MIRQTRLYTSLTSLLHVVGEGTDGSTTTWSMSRVVSKYTCIGRDCTVYVGTWSKFSIFLW